MIRYLIFLYFDKPDFPFTDNDQIYLFLIHIAIIIYIRMMTGIYEAFYDLCTPPLPEDRSHPHPSGNPYPDPADSPASGI